MSVITVRNASVTLLLWGAGSQNGLYGNQSVGGVIRWAPWKPGYGWGHRMVSGGQNVFVVRGWSLWRPGCIWGHSMVSMEARVCLGSQYGFYGGQRVGALHGVVETQTLLVLEELLCEVTPPSLAQLFTQVAVPAGYDITA